MSNKIKITVEGDGYIRTLNRTSPVMDPVRVSLETALYTLQDGFKVTAITDNGSQMVLDEKAVTRMIKRGDGNVEEIWKKGKKRPDPETEPDNTGNDDSDNDDTDDTDDNETDGVTSGVKTFEPKK